MLTQTSKYALRALAELARQPNGDFVRGQRLAELTAIPAKYLSKIMTDLRNAGYVATTRGLRGGYRLARAADTIPLLEIVELFEGPAARPQCLLGVNKECDSHRPCSAHRSWASTRARNIRFLERTMLAEISLPPSLRKGTDQSEPGEPQ